MPHTPDISRKTRWGATLAVIDGDIPENDGSQDFIEKEADAETCAGN